jgi:glycosyltransferase involved in cell wall biosynthesis
MITGRDIIFVSSIDWNYLWQVHQEIALRFARAGNRVVYIENTGIRSPGLVDTKRVALRLRRWASSWRTSGVREVGENVYVVSPLVLPPFGSKWLRLFNRYVLFRPVKRALRRLQIHHPIVWTYLPTDTSLDLIKELTTDQSTVIYYCVADFSQLTPHVDLLRKTEENLIKRSDLIFANSKQLAKHCGRWKTDLHVFPPGVDLERFQSNGKGHGERLAPNARADSRPVIGYIGGLHKFVDYDLLIAAARARPDWRWVLVGLLQVPIDELSELPNVSLPGFKPHQELPAYVQSFDVCLIPYLVNASTATVSPVKLNEYLAAGKPIVSTQLPIVCEFNQTHQILSTVDNKVEEFLSAIEDALRVPGDSEQIQRRRSVAALNDWNLQFTLMSTLISAKTHNKGSAVSHC